MTAVRWLVFAVLITLTGCNSTVGGRAEAQRDGAPTGPIQPAQLVDLLTPSMSLSAVPGHPLLEYDLQAALFVGADPEQCHGVVGFGRYPLFPANYTGREARTQVDSATNQHQLLEVSATYPGDFDAAAFLDSVRGKVADCQHPVAVWGDDQRRLTVNPAALIPGAPEIAHWTTGLSGEQWTCEFSIVAKANVVSEIITCSPDRILDNQALAAGRLKKINELLVSTA